MIKSRIYIDYGVKLESHSSTEIASLATHQYIQLQQVKIP